MDSTSSIDEIGLDPDVVGAVQYRNKPILEIAIATRDASRAQWFGVSLRRQKFHGHSEPIWHDRIVQGSRNPNSAYDWVKQEMGGRHPDQVDPSPWGLVFYADNRTQVKDWLLEHGHVVEWQGYPVRIDIEKREERRRKAEMTTGYDMGGYDGEGTGWGEGGGPTPFPSRTAQTRAETLRARAARLAGEAQARADRLLAEATRLDAMPPEPEGEPALIFFRKQFHPGGQVYDYAALRAGDGRWYTTGPKSTQGYTWEQLLGFIYPDGTDLDAVEVWQTTDMVRI